MIRINNVKKIFHNGTNDFIALDSISMTIPDCSFTAITGNSGSGKSTLLSLIGLLDRDYSGAIDIDGIATKYLSNEKAARFRLSNIGFVFQAFHLEPAFSAYENIELPLIISGMASAKRRKIILDYMERFGLSDKVNIKAKNLSGGEMQRVAIIRALINNPRIILADEPCGNLDSANGKMIISLLKTLVNENCITVILVTHNAEDAKQCDKIITLEDGRIKYNEDIASGK